MNIDTAMDIHCDTFRDVFQLQPKEVHSWGGMSDESRGFDDNQKGVQWNSGVNWRGSSLVSGDLGVNLEGNKYVDRPIGRLIKNELGGFSLFKTIAFIDHPENIMVRWTRDVWAGRRNRVDLQPFLYVPLSSLTEPQWRSALTTAQGCLQYTGNSCERALQLTTVKGVTRQREVTPHLTFIYELWRDDPVSRDEVKTRMQCARRQLGSLHREMGALLERR